ncbi:MAG: hypothetical protein PHQ52_03430 [Candidatus Omnitrophica bacterium]|nr:hypothetical protein [Candidatus Omnitrophota bacterium]
MKKYIQPKIKCVELDPKQALLQVCAIGGVYFEIGSQCGLVIWPTTYTATCNTGVKGNSELMGYSAKIQYTNDMPS